MAAELSRGGQECQIFGYTTLRLWTCNAPSGLDPRLRDAGRLIIPNRANFRMATTIHSPQSLGRATPVLKNSRPRAGLQAGRRISRTSCQVGSRDFKNVPFLSTESGNWTT